METGPLPSQAVNLISFREAASTVSILADEDMYFEHVITPLASWRQEWAMRERSGMTAGDRNTKSS